MAAKTSNMVLMVNDDWQIHVDLNGNHVPQERVQSKDSGNYYWRAHKKYFLNVVQSLNYIAEQIAFTGGCTITIQGYIDSMVKASEEINQAVMRAIKRISEDDANVTKLTTQEMMEKYPMPSPQDTNLFKPK